MIRSGLKASHADSTVASIASVDSRPKNSPSRSRAACACGSRAARRQSSFDFVGIGRVTQIVRDAECVDLGGETRRHDDEDLVAAFSRGIDEGHQGIEVPGQARGTEE